MNKVDKKIEMLFLVEKNVPFNGSIQASISNGLTVDYTNGLTLEEYCEKKGKEYEAISWDGLKNRMDAFHESLVTEPEEISEDEYIEMLDVLPPCRYHMRNGITFFHMSERISGALVTWCCEAKGYYFSFVDFDYVTNDYLLNKVKPMITRFWLREGKKESVK